MEMLKLKTLLSWINIELDNIVLGIDEYLEGNARNEQLEYIRFKKYYQRIYKQTEYNYVKWFQRAGQKTLHILGHSLDITDKDALQYIFNRDDVETIIYYHSDSSKDKMIINLIKVLGYDKVNELARGRGKSSISFSPWLGNYTS